MHPQIQYWLMAIRPRTLPAGAAPVVLGLGLAWEKSVCVWAALATLFCCILMQVGANLVNDYFDYVHGVDDRDRLGPDRMTQKGLIAPHHMRAGIVICFGLALLLRGSPGAAGRMAHCRHRSGIYRSGVSLHRRSPAPFVSGHGRGAGVYFFRSDSGRRHVLSANTGSYPACSFSGPGAGIFVRHAYVCQQSAGYGLGHPHRETHRGRDDRRIPDQTIFPGSAGCCRTGGAFLFHPSPGRLAGSGRADSILLYSKHWKALYSGPVDKSLNQVLAATGQYMFVYSLLFAVGITI